MDQIFADQNWLFCGCQRPMGI